MLALAHKKLGHFWKVGGHAWALHLGFTTRECYLHMLLSTLLLRAFIGTTLCQVSLHQTLNSHRCMDVGMTSHLTVLSSLTCLCFFLWCVLLPLPKPSLLGWWRGVVGIAFWLKRSYSMPGPVSTAMGDCLRAGKPSQCEACQLGRLSLLPSVGR